MPELSPGYHEAGIALRNVSLPSTVEIRFECWTEHNIAVGVSLRDSDRPNKWNGLGLLFTSRGSLRVFSHPPTVLFVQMNGDFVPAWLSPRFDLKKNTRYRFRLLREPRQMTLFVDDGEVARASVPELQAPLLGLGGHSDRAGETVYFDNVEVRAPADRP
jgi:hypothetical protein